MRRLALLGVALVALAGCQDEESAHPSSEAAPRRPSVTSASDEEREGGTLRYAIPEPAAIVPGEAVDREAMVVVDALFDSLTRWGPQLQTHAAAAVHWAPRDGARVWTFHLRPGATFHDDDATPVTADDFVFAWERAIRQDEVGYHLRNVEGYEALRRGDAEGLDGVVAVDEQTLEVRLREPDAEFPAVVAHPSLGPLPRQQWEADAAAFRAQPVGNGPFAASEPWARGQFIRVTPFDRWRNRLRKPSVTEVVFQILDADTAYLAFQQGRLDFTVLPPGALEDAEERYEPSADGYSGPGLLRGDVPVLYYLGFHVGRAPFDDVEVRRAVSLAVDRAAMAEAVREGNVTLARSVAPAMLPGARRGLCRTCRYDPQAAEAIFAEREITHLELWFNRGGGHERIARRLRADLDRAGVRLELRTAEFPEYLQSLRAGEAGMFRFGWAVDYPTMDNALRPILHSRSAEGGEAGHNHGRYAAADVDALLDSARATLDPEERHRRYRKAADLALNRDQAVVPLFTYRHAAVASDRVAGLEYNPMGLIDLVDVAIRDADSVAD